jgi:hypothetical protein
MNNAKHTPAPWFLDDSNPRLIRFYYPLKLRPPADNKGTLAEVWGSPEEVVANGRLMAAAPDLLEACMEVVASFDRIEFLNRANIDKCRDAIRKATGGNE